MKEASRDLIKQFGLRKYHCDFMGYKIASINDLSFHHLILSRQNCKLLQVPIEGYFKWNGAMLNMHTAHPYLHVIELLDEEIFYRITSELHDELIKGKLTRENLLAIRDLLLYFEKEHMDDRNSKGKRLIKQPFITERYPIEKD